MRVFYWSVNAALISAASRGKPMTRFFAISAFVLMCALAGPSFAEDAAGDWSGVLGSNLRLTMHLAHDPDGGYQGYIRSLDQGGAEIPLDHIVATPDTLSFHGASAQLHVDGRYEGRWDDATKQWTGAWFMGGRVELNFKRVSAPSAVVRPEEEARAMDQLVQAYVDDGSFMGSVLVTRKGKVLLDKGYGFADIAHAVPNTPQTAYRIGSITKQFTAASILLLQERGKLKVSDPVHAYLPDAPPAWDHITLYDLLTHSSGLVRDADPDGPGTGPEHLVAALHDKPLLFAPGDGYSYSNAGYELLGLIVEKVSGQAYGKFVHNNLFVPAGMTASAFKPEGDPHLAVGYDGGAEGPVPVPETAYARLYTAGGIVSTTHDLAQWQSALFNGRLLSADSLKLMTTPFKDGYGMGLEISNFQGHLDIGHGGLVHGFAADERYEPDEPLSVIVLGNLNGATTTVSRNLVGIAHGLPGTLPIKAVEIPQAILQTYVGTYVISPQIRIVVTLEHGQLMAEGGGYPKMALIGQSDQMFYTKPLGIRVEFVTGSGGAISLVLHLGGQPDRVGKRQ